MFLRPIHALTLVLAVATAGCGGLEQSSGPLAPAVPLSLQAVEIPPQPDSDNEAALAFSGINGRVHIPYSPLYKTPKFTVEMWVMVDSWRSGFTPLLASANTNEWNSADGYSMKFESNRVYLRAAKASNLAMGYYAPYVPPLKRWIHLAGTFDGAFGRVYVNGRLHTETMDERPTWYGARGLLLGSGSHSLFGGTTYFHGRMDEVRLWDHARSGNEILSTMEAELKGTEPGLLAYWNFERQFSGVVEDASGSGHHGQILGAVAYVGTTPF